MIRLNRWWYSALVLLVLGAFFIDTYSLTYRYVVAHIPLGKSLPAPPHIGGKDIYLHKGLDLQGGTELTIAICKGLNDPVGTTCRNGPPKGSSLSDAQKATMTILTQRVNGLGVAESTVQAQGDDQVLVQLPGIGIDQAIQTIGTTAKLHIATAVAGAPDPSNPTFLADQENLFDPAQLNNPTDYPSGYHWKIDDALQASNITKADIQFDTTKSEWAVTINFDGDGATEWSKITTAAFAASPGSPENRIAIFLDNQIITAPSVTGGGQSTSTEITGGFTQESAEKLASQISAGALPAEIATVQSSEVSATLGQDTVRKSIIAGAIGLAVVVLFMLGYYRFPGLLANVALLFYAAIVLALYKLLPVTVTLAGLAGFILSVGMAVDANVLIFERMRDELRHGRTVPLAVETGFRRAFPAIRDSNLSTLIACAVLYIFGSSVVRGFAVTLFIGVCVSFITAIYITRSLFALILRWHAAKSPRLYTEMRAEDAEVPSGRFDIVRSRNLFFLGSLVIIIPGIVAILAWGFRPGLDFSGGNRIDVALKTATTQAQVEGAVTGVAGDLRPQVQAEANNRFSIRTLPSSIDRVQRIYETLNTKYTIASDKAGRPDIQIQTVGPTIAAELVRNAIILVLLSSLLIAMYLAFAFRRQRAISAWRFSACTFFKLLHDVFVLAGIWAVIGHFSPLGEVDSLFVTALLTSVAFSIHDTIVVFDRVRENLRVGARMTFEQTVNLSTVQTMTRSLNTALTVVFVLVALVLFGGASIQGFVLALLIGIVTGTYSSIFNASTLLVAWEKSRHARTLPPTGSGARRIQARTNA